ncbi:MAG: SOS response-associated peptidase [Planctomycetota bacterium]
MCGRFTLQAPTDAILDLFDLEPEAAPPVIRPRYNVAPTQDVLALRVVEGERELVRLHWGLVPFFMKDAKGAARMINARSETVAEKPSFRAAFKRRRCLVPADGFYEWRKTAAGGKQPFHISMRDGRPFAFAGLWESWDKGPARLESCTILTTTPNELVAEVHDRMPVILDPEDFPLWLDPGVTELGALRPLFEAHPADDMRVRAVSTRVNSPRNDDPACLEDAG